ncbi:hypothetical protein FE257_008644 [Aspergillus nanangensis]|uniref:Zn(2)-C6 fungal-type domain-containing protein n=1 Tax=Aspergillus nanangensis TaxID=2582783 RepID=A0AAD4GTB8_ASPNN|nr:hypothetical protein FE257_008644 [Aspergillus nanangensis]
MPQDNTALVQASSPPTMARACDLCCRRKIRCERTFPCSNCQRMGVDCKISRRTTREKRKRTLISAEYEQKIDQIDQRLARLSRLVERLHADSLGLPKTTDHSVPSHPSLNSTVLSTLSRGPPDTTVTERDTRSPNNAPVAQPEHLAENEALVEGQSSLAAHSEFAIDFLHNIVGFHLAGKDGPKITHLLDTLRHMIDSFHQQRLSPKLLFPLAKSASTRDREGCPMAPLEETFARWGLMSGYGFGLLARCGVYTSMLLEMNNIGYLCISHVLAPRSLSDLCLKIYFSKEHSDVEFMIVNASLLCLSDDSPDDTNGAERFRLTCRTNLEAVLSGLSLYVKADYDMILALVLGAVYAIDISNPSLAWTLVSTASQLCHYLSLHTSAGCSGASPQAVTQRALLFWTVYFFEKTLCLRLGRSSTIPDCDITAPWPGDVQISPFPALKYCHQQVRLASLAGSIYEQLYSANALQLSVEARTNRALELVEQLDKHAADTREANELLGRSMTDDHDKEQLQFIFASDEIMRLSMVTLVHRVVPVQPDSITTFNKDCVSSARAALECHRDFVTGLAARNLPLVSAYITWTILYTPFVPFIVLFCHVIETGDKEDISRMRTFVTSIEGSCHHSWAIAKHHRLFQVFLSVAEHYTKLMSSSTPMEEEQRMLKSQVDAQLSALGLHPTGSFTAGHPTLETAPSAPLEMEFPGQISTSLGQDWSQQGLFLGNWFSFNQQMMGLMDQGDLPL